MNGYDLYLAEVVGIPTISKDSNDNRLQVRILPTMKNINSNICPRYPSFFKGKMFGFKKDSLVWCICNDDFSIGYILGEANYATQIENEEEVADPYYSYTCKDKDGDNKLIYLSIPNKDEGHDIGQIAARVVTSYFPGKKILNEFKNVEVTYWDRDTLHLIDKSTGGVVQIFSNGTVYIHRPDLFAVKIGENIITMDENGIKFDFHENPIRLRSKNIDLGNNATNSVMIAAAGNAKTATSSTVVRAE